MNFFDQEQERLFDEELKKELAKIAQTVRHLSMDAVQKANSGHPGLPLGCAELGAYLYGHFLRHNPKNPKWLGRDRFVLSAGHGSIWLYSLLYLSGFDLTLEDIKAFRQLHSKTAGHPESFLLDGVETTTGPLGQGIGNAVGMALGMKMLKEKVENGEELFSSSKVVFLAGDGCMMEGISHEASSFAGNLQLNNLIGIYDSNAICLDGPLSECSSENTKERYLAYGWDVKEVDGHDFDSIHAAFSDVREKQEKPLLIIAKTVIGKGSPHKEGSSKAHGAPLGEEEIVETKKALGLPLEEFYVPQSVLDFFKKKNEREESIEKRWSERCGALPQVSEDLYQEIECLEITEPVAGRKAAGEVLNRCAALMPSFIAGSADLSSSDMTTIKGSSIISKDSFEGRNIKFGVREFAMAAIATGLSQTGYFLPLIGTFLTFSDYMKNAIRLAALMKRQVIYQFTHDSVFLGEDGPTHQPIEQLAGLRSIPQLQVIRPAGAHEVKMAFLAALEYEGPTALVLSRQNISQMEETRVSYKEGMARGGYIVKKESDTAQCTLFATGSELSLALLCAEELERRSVSTRVVSMPCWELFDKQDESYKSMVLDAPGKKVSLEAASSMGWHRYIGRDGLSISIDSFGLSAPQKDLAKEFGFTVEAVLEAIL